MKKAVGTWKSDVYGLLPISHICIEVRVKVWAPEYLSLFMYVFPEISVHAKFLVSRAIRNVDLLKIFTLFLIHVSVFGTSSELYMRKDYYYYYYYYCGHYHHHHLYATGHLDTGFSWFSCA